MMSPSQDFESCASANSATPAYSCFQSATCPTLTPSNSKSGGSQGGRESCAVTNFATPASGLTTDSLQLTIKKGGGQIHFALKNRVVECRTLQTLDSPFCPHNNKKKRKTRH